MRLSGDGEAVMVNVGGAVTVSVTVVLCCTPPPVPFTVIGYVPGTALELTVIVKVECPVPGALIVVGVKLVVTPEGMPEADGAIELLKPFIAIVVMVLVL